MFRKHAKKGVQPASGGVQGRGHRQGGAECEVCTKPMGGCRRNSVRSLPPHRRPPGGACPQCSWPPAFSNNELGPSRAPVLATRHLSQLGQTLSLPANESEWVQNLLPALLETKHSAVLRERSNKTFLRFWNTSEKPLKLKNFEVGAVERFGRGEGY